MKKNKTENKGLKFTKEVVKLPKGNEIKIVMNGKDYVVGREVADILINKSNKAKLK